MRRAATLVVLLVLALPAPALAEPLLYEFDWRVEGRYRLWDSTLSRIEHAQDVSLAGRAPLTLSRGADGSLSFSWSDGRLAGRAAFPFPEFPTDSYTFSTGLDAAPADHGAFPRALGHYWPVGDPAGPAGFTLSLKGAGADCLRFLGLGCRYQYESALVGTARLLSASEPAMLGLTALGLAVAAGIARRRRRGAGARRGRDAGPAPAIDVAPPAPPRPPGEARYPAGGEARTSWIALRRAADVHGLVSTGRPVDSRNSWAGDDRSPVKKTVREASPAWASRR